MTPPLVEELRSLEMEGVETFDAYHGEKVLVVAPIICFVCDNPRASEVVNHIGPASKMFCRICIVGKTSFEFILYVLKSLLLTYM